MFIREVERQDLLQLLHLYTYLHQNEMPPIDDALKTCWCNIMSDPNHHIVVGAADDQIVSSCVLIIVPNLTYNQRPYAFVENVITHPEYRAKGYATRVLDFAKALAMDNNCYKIMLMTGSKKDETLNFYERCGYNMKDKTAFIQWLDEQN